MYSTWQSLIQFYLTHFLYNNILNLTMVLSSIYPSIPILKIRKLRLKNVYFTCPATEGAQWDLIYKPVSVSVCLCLSCFLFLFYSVKGQTQGCSNTELYPQLFSETELCLNSLNWAQIYDPPSLASRMMRLQAWAIMPGSKPVSRSPQNSCFSCYLCSCHAALDASDCSCMFASTLILWLISCIIYLLPNYFQER